MKKASSYNDRMYELIEHFSVLKHNISLTSNNNPDYQKKLRSYKPELKFLFKKIKKR